MKIGTVDLSPGDVRLLEYLYEPPAAPETSAVLAERLGEGVNVVRTRLGVLKRCDLVERVEQRAPGRRSRTSGWNLTAHTRRDTPWRP